MCKKIGGKIRIIEVVCSTQRALKTGEDSRPIFPLLPHHSSNAQVTQTNLYTSFKALVANTSFQNKSYVARGSL